MKKYLSVKRLAFVAVFSALSCVLYLFLKFPLPIFPSFLEINFSMIPIIICAFMLGPVDATVIVLIRFLIKLITISTHTAGVGEIADLIIGASVAITSGVIYNYTHIKGKTLISLLSGALVWVIASMISNYFFNIPIYLQLYFGGNDEPLIGMISTALNTFVKFVSFGQAKDIVLDSTNYMGYYIWCCVLPFNLILSFIVMGFTALVHRKLKVLYDSIDSDIKRNKTKIENV